MSYTQTRGLNMIEGIIIAVLLVILTAVMNIYLLVETELDYLGFNTALHIDICQAEIEENLLYNQSR